MKMKKYILSIIVFTAALFAGLPVFAEGSKDLYPNGVSGYRAYLMSNNQSVPQALPFGSRGVHYVYAKAGEHIALASSEWSGSSALKLYDPDGNDVTPNRGNNGRITNRAQEIAGPKLSSSDNTTNRYTPVYYTVPSGKDGVYRVEFWPTTSVTSQYSNATREGSADNAWTNWNSGNDGSSYVAAWDVSVIKPDRSGFITGRVYANMLNMGILASYSASEGWYGKMYVLTKDGYVYRVDNNGSNGIVFSFFVNNNGFVKGKQPNGSIDYSPLYKSLNYIDQAVTNNQIWNPTIADQNGNITHKMFYTLPAFDDFPETDPKITYPNGTKGTTWLKTEIVEPKASGLKLVGVDGTVGQMGSKGGYIQFTSDVQGQYIITIKNNNSSHPFTERIITGPATSDLNSVYWDGLDKNGIKSPQGVNPFTIEVVLQGAEVHFPYFDMEHNRNGIKLELLERTAFPSMSTVSDIVYWNDTDISKTGNSSNYSNPINNSHLDSSLGGVSSVGINSASGSNPNGHKWGNGQNTTTSTFGDLRSMDTWTFIKGEKTELIGDVVHKVADLYIDEVSYAKDGSGPIRIGDEITYTVVAGNKEGSCPVEGAPFSFILPPGFVYEGDLSDIVFTPTSDCGSQSGLSYDSETRTFSSKLDLDGSCDATGNDCKVTYTFKVKVTDQATSANTTATATIMRPADVTDPDATNISDPAKTEFTGTVTGDTELDPEYYYHPTDPFFEVNNNGIEDNISNNIKNNQISNFIDDIRADNDINQTPVGIPVNGNVLTNDYSSNGILSVGSAKYYDSSGEKKTLELGVPAEIYTENGDKAGTLKLDSDGGYTFSPATGFVGDVPVEYTAINGVTTESSNNTADAILTITVIPATVPGNNPPIALDDVATTKKGVILMGDILANDSDPDAGDVITVIGATQGGENISIGTSTPVSGKDKEGNTVDDAGSITINANGKITFVPNGNFVGTVDPIEYTISDGKGGTDKANIYITVIEDDGNTTFANDDANTAKKGVTMTGNVLDNDFDPEGDDQTLTKITIDGTSHDVPVSGGNDLVVNIVGKGTLTIDKDGKYTFAPETEFVGTVVVEQTVCDDGEPLACDNATLYLTSLPESDNSTTAVDDFYETGNNTPITGNVMENDYDNEGDTQRVTTTGTFTTTEGGTVAIDENGDFTYTPPADKNGIFDTFKYQVCDNGTPQACDEAEVTIAVGICYKEVDGTKFEWRYSTGSGVVTETITQPAANYGFTFDIYELDNSFNMEINGVKLAVEEIEFQSSGTSGINIEFADGNQYEVHTQGTGGKAIWQMRGNAANPLIRVVISPNGQVSMYGSKVNNGPLFPLRFKKEKGNKFNKINFSNVEDTTNEITVTQNIVGVTIIEGYGYGRNQVDCPNYWHGYNDNEWAENSNWTDNYVPKAYEDIEFATASNNSGVIQGMSGPGAGKGAADKDLYLDNVNQDGTGGRIIKDLINDSDVDLVITTTNQLIIDGEVKDNNPDAGTIVVKSAESEATGTLLFSNPSKNESVNATVEFYNKAFTCPDCGFYRKQWQYFGIPVDKSKFPYLSPHVETINEWMENVDGNKWVNRAANYGLEAFRGYEINNSNTTKPTHIYEFSGILNVEDAEVTLTKTPNVNYSGMNLIANSFTAAIPISEDAISYSDNSWNKMVYLFNAGTRDQWRKLNGGIVVHDTQSGQYKSVPLKLAGQLELDDRIPSMHTFMVDAPSSGTMTIAYDKLTNNGLVDGMAWRSTDNNAKRELPYIVLDMIGESSVDRVWLFEESSTTRGFDNGWDGHKIIEEGLIQAYVLGMNDDKYQVATVPQIDGTSLSVSAMANESYTISVAAAADVEVRRLYLQDTFTGRGYLLKNGAEFVISGTRSANQNRFKITSSPITEVQNGDDASIINTYVRDNVIVVENRSNENATVSVYDISGRFVGKAQIGKNEVKSFVEFSINSGVKVVKVVSNSGSINRSDRVLLK